VQSTEEGATAPHTLLSEYVFRLKFHKMNVLLVYFTHGAEAFDVSDDEDDEVHGYLTSVDICSRVVYSTSRPLMLIPPFLYSFLSHDQAAAAAAAAAQGSAGTSLPFRPLIEVVKSLGSWMERHIQSDNVFEPHLYHPGCNQWVSMPQISDHREAQTFLTRFWSHSADATARGDEPAAATAESVTPASTGVTDSGGDNTDDFPLPAGWTRHTSEKHNVPFYMFEDGTVQWEPPQ
jgi:hypothetical protein